MGKLHNYAGVYGKFKAQSCPEHQLREVRACIAQGHDVNEKNSYGNTPAYLSARSRNMKVTAALVKAGADLNIRNKYGVCAMDFINENDDYDELVNLGVDMQAHRERSIRHEEERRKNAKVLDVITLDEDSNHSIKQEEEENDENQENRKRKRVDDDDGCTEGCNTTNVEVTIKDEDTSKDDVTNTEDEEDLTDDENGEPLDYLIRLKLKGILKDELTKDLIRNSFCNESDISTTSITVSLKCPLSKKVMKYPCRSTACSPQHLQMFDAASLFQMTQKRDGQWLCPVCDQPLKFEHLALDGYFTKIVRTIRADEVGVRADGTWYPLDESVQREGILHVTESPLKEINNMNQGNANRGQPDNAVPLKRVKSENEFE